MRNYAKENQQRNAKARAEGFGSYAKKRALKKKAADKIAKLSSDSNRKLITQKVSKFTADDIQKTLGMTVEDIRKAAKTDAKYHYHGGK